MHYKGGNHFWHGWGVCDAGTCQLLAIYISLQHQYQIFPQGYRLAFKVGPFENAIIVISAYNKSRATNDTYFFTWWFNLS